ncbi:MAG: hydroxymethylglutaryl-CoA reductase [Bacteroidetes bacterium]|nr:hydroxymethylglutaryl-CoA reductase [Bacteroidota bacterium]
MNEKLISGFSKWSKQEKIDWLNARFGSETSENSTSDFSSFWLENESVQETIDGFSENTISNFILPYGIAPNFLINGIPYAVPMVIEESSVVAAASSAAKFWLSRGGFKTRVLSTVKIGQIHFIWQGDSALLHQLFPAIKNKLLTESKHLGANMIKRGGGVTAIELLDFNHLEKGLYQIRIKFETVNSMGANFINTHLESFSKSLRSFFDSSDSLSPVNQDIDVIMAILSNYTPECLVTASVSCPVSQLQGVYKEMKASDFAKKFRQAVRIAEIDIYRATTHNKGIFNGIDAVVIATGNDFRAVEAAGHAYASRDGVYKSLSHCHIENDIFTFSLTIPLAIGTIGGLTHLHPLAKKSLAILGEPDARLLMQIIAAVGLAQNFAAIKSLITSGIQDGHMRMHLMNILAHLEADENEKKMALTHFTNIPVSFSSVREFIDSIRSNK